MLMITRDIYLQKNVSVQQAICLKLILLSIILNTFSVVLFSQQNEKIDFNIIVVDSTNNERLPFVTIQLFDVRDSILQYGTITNENGLAKINYFTGAYFLSISCIGYITYHQQIDLQKNSNNTKIIKLALNQYSLGEVEVLGNKTGTRLKNDKIEFVPSQSDLKNAVTAIDLLQKIPDVTVNKVDNSIKVIGNKNVMILIDGNLLKINIESIHAEDIEKIEIFNNPDVKYDFDITTAVNFVIKENRKKGLKLLLNLRADVIKFSTWDNFQIDYDIGKLHFFVENRLDFNNFKMKYTEKTTTLFESSIFETEENTSDFYRSQLLIYTMQYGLNYSPDKNNFFNFTGNFKYNSQSLEIPLFKMYKIDNQLFNNSNIETEKETKNLPHNFSVFYKRIFNNKHELSFNNNFYFNQFESVNRQFIEYFKTPEDSTISYNILSNENAKNKSLNSKIDYHLPINEKWITDFGTQFYFRNINSNYFIGNENSLFRYSDYRVSLYNSLNYYVSERLNLKAGIRIEEVFSTVNDTVKFSNFNYMPSFSAGYRINENNLLRLNIFRKTVYPDYYNLSSHIYYSIDSMSAQKGNPLLKPLNELKIQLQYNLRGNFAFLTFMPTYSLSNNSISTAYKVAQNGAVDSETINISKINKVGAYYSMHFSLFDIFEPYFETEIFYSYFPQKVNNGFSYSTEIGMEVDLPANYYLEMIFMLKNTERDYSSIYKENFSFEYFILGKTFLKGAINVSFLLREFVPSIRKSYTIDEQLNYKNEFMSNTYPKYMVRFRYVFRQGKDIKNKNVELNMEKEIDNNRVKIK